MYYFPFTNNTITLCTIFHTTQSHCVRFCIHIQHNHTACTSISYWFHFLLYIHIVCYKQSLTFSHIANKMPRNKKWISLIHEQKKKKNLLFHKTYFVSPFIKKCANEMCFPCQCQLFNSSELLPLQGCIKNDIMC